MRVAERRADIVARTGEIIIDADYLGSVSEQAVAQMRTEESGTAGDEDAFS